MIFWNGPQLIPVKTDQTGNLIMNIIPRTGLKADLLALAGQNGEVAAPTDAGDPSLIRLTGVAGKAASITPYQNVVVKNHTVAAGGLVFEPHFAKLVLTGPASLNAGLSAGVVDGQEVAIEYNGTNTFTPSGMYKEDGATSLATADFTGKIVRVRWDAAANKWIRFDSTDKGAAFFLLATASPASGFVSGPGSNATGLDSWVSGRENVESVPTANPGAIVAGNNNSVAADGAIVIGNKVQVPAIAVDSIIIDNNPSSQYSGSQKAMYSNAGMVALGCNPKTSRTNAWGNKAQNVYSTETILNVVTTGATPTSMTTDGAAPDYTNFLNLIAPLMMFQGSPGGQTGDTVFSFRARITGHVSGSADYADFDVVGSAWWNNTAFSMQVGVVTVTPVGKSAALNAATVSVDAASLLGLEFKATGVAGKTIKWIGKVDAVVSVNA